MLVSSRNVVGIRYIDKIVDSGVEMLQTCQFLLCEPVLFAKGFLYDTQYIATPHSTVGFGHWTPFFKEKIKGKY